MVGSVADRVDPILPGRKKKNPGFSYFRHYRVAATEPVAVHTITSLKRMDPRASARRGADGSPDGSVHDCDPGRPQDGDHVRPGRDELRPADAGDARLLQGPDGP